MALLEVTGLHMRYGESIALRGVSVRVEPQELVAVVGANGAGKTTLIRAIMGLQPPREGTIRFAGRDLAALPPWERTRRGLALVPEGRRIFGDLTVRENLVVGGYLHDEPSDLDHVYELFPALRDRRDQVARTLSGGEQQMLATGRALMARPKLLLADELSTGLMPRLVREVLVTLRSLRDRGMTVLLVEQNARQALQVADRGYVLEVGRVVAEGPSDQLRADPKVRAAYLGGVAR